ncbi:MAG: hypothetical protein MK066_05255 [Crocinitomicaceae bacterium]|nr:hypothetical protein [Crocinitomicaceae bacterium]
MGTVNKFPLRIKYYLAEWKNENKESYKLMYGNSRLDELSIKQLGELLWLVSHEDLGAILNE